LIYCKSRDFDGENTDFEYRLDLDFSGEAVVVPRLIADGPDRDCAEWRWLDSYNDFA
jgi:hypothetical protein